MVFTAKLKYMALALVTVLMLTGCDWVKGQLGLPTSGEIAMMKQQLAAKEAMEQQRLQEEARLRFIEDSLAQVAAEQKSTKIEGYHVIIGAFKDYSNADALGKFVEGIQDSLLQFNYAYIAELNRYYFVNDIVLITAKLYQINMICDLLMTYKESFLPLTAYIERNEFEYDPLIVDADKPYLADREITTRDMTKDNLVNTEFVGDIELTGKNVYLATFHQSTNMTDSNHIENVPSPYATLTDIESAAFSMSLNHSVYALSVSDFGSFVLDVMQDEDIATFIAGACVYPFIISKPSGAQADCWESTHIYAGTYKSSTKLAMHYGYGTLSPYLIIADETFDDLESFEETNPYQSIEFYLPFHGFIDIDPRSIAGKRIIVFYNCDMVSGSGDVCIYNVTVGVSIYRASCALGVPLGFTIENVKELERLRASNAISTTLGLVGAGLSIVGGAASGNVLAVAGGALSAAKTIGSAVTTEMNAIPRANVKTSSPNGGYYNSMNVQIRITRMKAAPLDEAEYAHAYGKPLQSTRALNLLHGYTSVGKIHLDGVTALASEAQSLSALLESGVILP